MKTAILHQFDELQIKRGDTIPNESRASIRRAIAGDSMTKTQKFFAAWYQLTNDGPGCGTWPNLPVRVK